jgi:hypothetical protein
MPRQGEIHTLLNTTWPSLALAALFAFFSTQNLMPNRIERYQWFA